MPAESHNSLFQFPEIKVVEASAGSGKTFSLAKRYLQLLFHPTLRESEIPWRQILAITFTNRAAQEMKKRILDFLKRIALRQLPEDERQDILVPLGQDLDFLTSQAASLMDQIIRHYHFFQVQTIDSFINAILSGCSFKIYLSANFRIETQEEEYLQGALDRLIDRAQQEPGVRGLFEEFLFQYLFHENRTSWFPKKEMLALLSSLFKEGNCFGKDFQDFPVSPKDREEMRKNVRNIVTDLESHLPTETDSRFRHALEIFRKKNQLFFPIDKLSDFFNRDEFPLRKGYPPSPHRLPFCRQANGATPDFAANFSKTDDPGEAKGKSTLAKTGHFPDAALEQRWQTLRRQLRELCEAEAFGLFNCYADVFRLAKAELEGLARQDDVVFLSELNRQAQTLFDREQLSVQELYYRLASPFHHFLVDEFQDTSALQWRNLTAMIEEALSTGGSLFYVGDKKQAIYGFRGGEALLFDDIKKRFAAFPVSTQILRQNWRSEKAVVEFNNAVFSRRNLTRFLTQHARREDKPNASALSFTEADTHEILAVFRDSAQVHLDSKSGGFVHSEHLSAKNNEELYSQVCEKLLALIPRLQERFPLNEIAILARDNTDVELITNWLLQGRILVDSERTSNIRENFLIKEIVSLLHFLDSPIDNLNFASFLIGDIFLSASQIPAQELHAFIFHFHQRTKEMEDQYLYKAFREIYPQVWEEFFEEFFKNVGMYPLYELVVTILHRFDPLGKFPSHQGFLLRLLQIIKEREEESADLSSFLEYFSTAAAEDFYVPSSQMQAIRVLTIHKAKGLEFGVVIIPFLVMDIKVGTRAVRGQRSFVVENLPDHLQLVQVKKRYAQFSPLLAKIYQREYKKSFLAELNNLYVALTRAKKEMYLLIPSKCGNSHNPVKLLIPQAVMEEGKEIIYEQAPVSQTDSLLLPSPRYRDWIELLRDEFVEGDTIRRRQEIHNGEVVHFILSFIGNLHDQDLSARLQAAREALAYQFPFLSDEKWFMEQAESLVQHPSLRQFFVIADGTVYQEKDFVDRSGQTKRMDRLIVKSKEVWVVDYKQSRSKGYLTQLREYMHIVSELYRGYRVRGFLIFLNEMTAEEVQLSPDFEWNPEAAASAVSSPQENGERL